MNRTTIVIATLVALFVAVRACLWASGADGSALVLVAVTLLPVALYVACKFPEIVYAIFVDAGLFKGDQSLTSIIPAWLDLTIAFGALTLVGIIYNLAVRRKPLALPPSQLLLPYVLFTAWAGISLSFTTAPTYGTEKFLRFATITSLALYAPLMFQLDAVVLRRALTVFVVIAMAMLFDVFQTGVQPMVFETRGAFGGDYLSLGRATGLALVIVMFCYLVYARNALAMLFYIGVSTLLAMGTFLSGGRAPLLGAVGTVGLIFASLCLTLLRGFMFRSRPQSAQLRMTFVMLAVAGLTALVVSVYSAYFTATWDRLTLLSSGSGDYSDGRVPRYELAEAIITTWPTGVTGVGIGGFVAAFAGYDTKEGDYPHNIFLEIGSELGVIGLIPFVWMLTWAVRRLRDFARAESSHLHISYTLLGMLVFELINSCISGDINGNRTLFACIGLIGGLSATGHRLAQARNRAYTVDDGLNDVMVTFRPSEGAAATDQVWT